MKKRLLSLLLVLAMLMSMLTVVAMADEEAAEVAPNSVCTEHEHDDDCSLDCPHDDEDHECDELKWVPCANPRHYYYNWGSYSHKSDTNCERQLCTKDNHTHNNRDCEFVACTNSDHYDSCWHKKGTDCESYGGSYGKWYVKNSWGEYKCGHDEHDDACYTCGNPHAWDNGVVTPATCTENGYTTYTCDACKNYYVVAGAEATGHDWDNGKVTTPATCTEKGVMTYTCKNNASHTYTEEIPALGHDWGDWERVEKGSWGNRYYEHTRECKVPGCDAKETHLEDYGWNGWNGWKGNVKVGSEVKPTCEDKGYTNYSCDDCDLKWTGNYKDAKGHDWDNGKVTTPATCTEKGVKTFTCKRDASHTFTRDIPAKGHDWDNGKVTTPATCTEKGVKTFTCKRDASHTFTRDIPAKGHYMIKTNAKAATCTEDGNREYFTCITCKKVFEDKAGKKETTVAKMTIEALGHDWNEGVVTTPATCTTEGVKTFTCLRDASHTKEESVAIDPDNHDLKQVAYKAPNCTDIGWKAYEYCDRDGCEYTTYVEIPALGHFMSAWYQIVAPTADSQGMEQRDCMRYGCTYHEYRPLGYSEPVVNIKGLDTVNHIAYLVGVGNDKVDPNGEITRAQVASIFFRLMTEDYRNMYWSSVNSFSDVPANAWYNRAVSTLEAAGVIKDTVTGGKFRPEEPITRAELAVMAAQFCTVNGGSIPAASFIDVPVYHWAAEEIALVQYAGWIYGFGGSYRPEDNLTRAEAVAIVNRMLQRGAEDENMVDGMITFVDNLPGFWYYEEIQEATNSHTYTRTNVLLTGESFFGEKWVGLTANPDWAAIEKGWVAANN